MHVFFSGHYHAGHPEENDVGTCYEDRRGVIVLDFTVAGIGNAVKEADGPEPAGEPCVQGIFITVEVGHLEIGTIELNAGFLEGLFGCLCYDKLLCLLIIAGNEVGRNAMAPP